MRINQKPFDLPCTLTVAEWVRAAWPSLAQHQDLSLSTVSAVHCMCMSEFEVEKSKDGRIDNTSCASAD